MTTIDPLNNSFQGESLNTMVDETHNAVKGEKVLGVSGGGGGGDVNRSGNTVDGNIAVWEGNNNSAIRDGGPPPVASFYKEFKLDVDAVDASLIPLLVITSGYYSFTLSYDAGVSAIILTNNSPIASGVDYRATYFSKLSSDPNEQNLEKNQSSNNGVTSYINAVAATSSFLSNGFFPGSEGDKQYFDLFVDANLRTDGFIFQNMSIFRDWGGVTIKGDFRAIAR